MDAIRRTSTLRRVATTASLAALLLTPGAADAKKKAKPKSPVITSVAPMTAKVGDTLTIKGRNFRKGKGKNSVGFKRDGAAVVFIKSDVSTTKTMYVKLSAKLDKVLYGGQSGVFRLRVLAGRFGTSYTSKKLSPTIGPKPEVAPTTAGSTGSDGTAGAGGTTSTTAPPAFDPAGPYGDCDGDKILNKDETGDIDNDLLSDALENTIGTDGCNADTDGDGVTDAYEYKSAVDLNDDEYQSPNTVIPYPGARPYPNPLEKDADKDYDGDSLTLGEEYALWSKQGGLTPGETYQTFATTHLSYSDGLQYSVYTVDGAGHRVPALNAAGYDKRADFLAWASANGYASVTLPSQASWTTVTAGPVNILDINRGGSVNQTCDPAHPLAAEAYAYDLDCNGVLSDDERDEDADGLTNFDETHGPAQPGYWTACYGQEAPYKIAYAGTDVANADSDGDGIRDGADDQDHDDLPNLMELSRMQASVAPGRPDGYNDTDGHFCKPADGLDPKNANHADAYGKVNPFNPCDPLPSSRTCDRHRALGTEPDPEWWSLH